ncbi:MAG TPA: type II toxin-antitoxin system prevent-host-death family antitoxin [Caldilineae bacterium]|jgi:prevent-host-death family protein|nr:type II toxin-antitoxin system prevent-host-death family antitoxin [Caldilineae bacterium]
MITRVGVRELKARLSEYLRQVKAGQTVIITERGKPIGRIVPEMTSTEERLRALVDAGLAEWSGGRLKPDHPLAVNRSSRLLSDIVSEDRDVDYLSGHERVG